MTILDTLLEVRIAEEEDFLKIKETLTRIGVASKKEKKLYQSCHILHKRGRYYIVHFKELFLPLYSSTLNPIEVFWSLVKRRWSKNLYHLTEVLARLPASMNVTKKTME